MSFAPAEQTPQVVGRYMLCRPLASGGMGTVYLGRLLGPAGFSRVVAIKRLHAGFATDPSFVAMTMDEARVASRVRHPNVVQTVDVVTVGEELLLVLEYVHGESLSKLIQAALRAQTTIPPAVVVSIVAGALHGLHAAHEATSEHGQPLHIVHRDVSPQNVLVGVDGVARVCDFGVAKASGRLQVTSQGELKGKIGYMAPEQISGRPLDRRVDVFAAGVVAWEALTGRRLFHAENEAAILHRILNDRVPPPSEVVPAIPRALDDVLARALAREASSRFSSALELAIALEHAVAPAPAHEVGRWVSEIAANALEIRADDVAEVEAMSVVGGATAPAADVAGAPKKPASTARRYVVLAGVAAVMFSAGFGIQKLGGASRPPASPEAPRPATSTAASLPIVPASADAPVVVTDEAPNRGATTNATAAPEPTGARPVKKATAGAPVRRATSTSREGPSRSEPTPACQPPYTYFDPVERIDKVKPECRGAGR